MRESEVVQSLKSISVYTPAFNFIFKMSIYSNLCPTLSIYVSRLSIRPKFNHPYNHCLLAQIHPRPFPFRLFLADIPKASLSLALSATTTTSPSSTFAAGATAAKTTAFIMSKDNNNNKKNNNRDNNERQKQVREERERRRREAEQEVANAPVLGTQRLFSESRRGANVPVDVNVGQLFISPAADSSASSTPPVTHHPITATQVEAALAAAAATALPEEDDEDFLLQDDGGVDVSDGVQSYEDSELEGMDHDGTDAASGCKGPGTLRVQGPTKPNEVVVDQVRDWTPACQKDGSKPKTVRDIGVQANFGGASIERHRRYLRASRNRQRKRNLAKKRARASETTPPNPDTVGTPSSCLRQSGSASLTSLPAGNAAAAPPSTPVVEGGATAPIAESSRDRGSTPPAKVRKTGTPSKKKEPWWVLRKANRKEKKDSSQREADQQPPSSGVAPTPRRKIELQAPISARSLVHPKVHSPHNEDLRVTIASRRHSRSHSRSASKVPPIIDPASAALIKGLVQELNASIDRKFRRRSPSPHCSHQHRSQSRQSCRSSRYPSHQDVILNRFYDEVTSDEEDKESRSRSRSRGRPRQRQPPPSNGKGKGKGKGRGK